MDHKTLENTLKIKSDEGFTLIEVLIAMAIFLIGILAVGTMQISAVNSNASARMRTEATMIAAQHVERLLALPFSDLDAVVASSEYDPHDQGPYRINRPTLTPIINGEELKVIDSGDVNNRIVNVTVQWMKRGRNRSVTYSVMAVDM